MIVKVVLLVLYNFGVLIVIVVVFVLRHVGVLIVIVVEFDLCNVDVLTFIVFVVYMVPLFYFSPSSYCLNRKKQHKH